MGQYPLERTRERYLILYTWKIIEGLVPNQCNLVSLHTRKRPNLLNSLPAYLRNLTDIPIQKFKKELERSLRNIPDEPGVPQYTKYRAAPLNSLVDQIQYHIRGQAWHTSNGQWWMRNSDQVSKSNAVSMMRMQTKSSQKYVSQDRGGSSSTTGRPNSDVFF